jgi:hypothetical protein
MVGIITSQPRYESQACETSLANPNRTTAIIIPPIRRSPVVSRAKSRNTSLERAADGDMVTVGTFFPGADIFGDLVEEAIPAGRS